MTTPKQEAIRAALQESPGLSNRQIAKLIGGAHHVTVGNVRKALEGSGELQRDTVTGGDGKSYSKAKTSKPRAKAKKPVSLDDQVTRAMSGLLRTAKRDERLEELADAFRRYYAAHLVPPPVTSSLAEVGTEVADPPTVTAKPPEPARQPAKDSGSPALRYRDVARDIQPDDDDNLPTAERIALHEDQAALEPASRCTS
jgi:transposase